jgi:hypothetical protein
MTLADLLKQRLDVDCEDVWVNERTPTPVRVFGARMNLMGLSLREIVAVLDWLAVRNGIEGANGEEEARVVKEPPRPTGYQRLQVNRNDLSRE